MSQKLSAVAETSSRQQLPHAEDSSLGLSEGLNRGQDQTAGGQADLAQQSSGGAQQPALRQVSQQPLVSQRRTGPSKHHNEALLVPSRRLSQGEASTHKGIFLPPACYPLHANLHLGHFRLMALEERMRAQQSPLQVATTQLKAEPRWPLPPRLVYRRPHLYLFSLARSEKF